MVNKRLNAQSDRITVVSDSLMRNLDIVNVEHESGSLTERDTVVYMVSEDKPQNMGRSGDIRQIYERNVFVVFRERRKFKVKLTVYEPQLEQMR